MHMTDHSEHPFEAGHRTMRGKRRALINRDTLTHKMLYAWFHMAKSTQRLINDNPGERYMLILLMLSNLGFFMSWTMKAVIVPNEAGTALVSAQIGFLFFSAIVLRTGVLYLFAMVLAAMCRIFGGQGSWEDTRTAVFWGAFVTMPMGIAAAILSVLFTNLAIYFPIFNAPWIAVPPYWAGTIPFVWYVSAGVAKVHGFSRTSPLFLSMSVVALVAFMGAMYFHAIGMI